MIIERMVGIILFLASIQSPIYGQTTLSPSRILDIMRGFDAVYSEGWYVAGTTAYLESPYTPGIPTYPMSFELTQEGNRGGMYLNALELPPAQNADGEAPRYAPFVHLGSYYDEEIQGITDVTFAGEGGFLSGQPIDYDLEKVLINLNNNFGHTRDKRFEITERALGRGYTRFATGASDVAKLPDGTVKVHLQSNEFGTGEWRLVLDPSAGYLVREAKFYRSEENEPIVVASNVGLIPTDDQLFVPTEGVYEDFSDIYNGALPVEVHSTALSVDKQLLSMTKAMLDINTFEQAMLVDESGEKRRLVKKFGGMVEEGFVNDKPVFDFDLSDVTRQSLREIEANLNIAQPVEEERSTPPKNKTDITPSARNKAGLNASVALCCGVLLTVLIAVGYTYRRKTQQSEQRE